MDNNFDTEPKYLWSYCDEDGTEDLTVSTFQCMDRDGLNYYQAYYVDFKLNTVTSESAVIVTMSKYDALQLSNRIIDFYKEK